MMEDSKKELNTDEFIESYKNVDIRVRDYRADDDFEKMFAELSGKGKNTEVLKPENKDTAQLEKPKAEKNDTQSKKATAAMSTAVAAAPSAPVHTARTKAAQPVKQTAAKRATHNTAAQKQVKRPTKTAEQIEAERIKKTQREREKKLIEGIANIWDSPDFTDGGRVSVNIKTGERKEIHVTIPPEAVEKAKEKAQADRDAALKAEAKKDAARRAAASGVVQGHSVSGAVKRPVGGAKEAEKGGTKRLTKTEIVRKQFALVNVMVCFAIFFGLGFFLLVCQRESGFIQSENRNLAEKPKLSVSSLIDGSYFTDITDWYTDTIPGREELKSVSSSFTKLFGITLNDVKLTGDIKAVKKETFDEASTKATTEVTINTDFTNTASTTRKKKTTTETEELAEVPEELDDGEWMGNVVVAGKGENVRAMSAFYGTFEMGKMYAETINKYREDLGDSINIYTMNMPTSSAYYMPSNLADEFTSQHDCIKNIGSNLSGIVNVDVYTALEDHKSEYIYSRTDHHWQPLGAYYAAQVFAEKASFDFPDLSTYEKCVIEDFVGTMYAYSDYDEELNQNPDTFTYYKPDNDYSVTYYDSYFSNAQYGGSLFFDYASGVNCYSAILGTDDEIAELVTDCDNGRVLVIFKDSFGNALVPYLTHGFSKIYVCDFRYFDINAIDFIYDVGATDVLFAVSLAAAHTESHINTIGNIRIQSSQTEEDAALPEENIPDEDALVIIPDDDTDEDDNTEW